MILEPILEPPTDDARRMLREHEVDIRVRYQETDAQGRVHHANYLTYFEVGRTELMRAAGYDYRQLESDGTMLVVHEISCTYHQPACYDDVLRLRTTIVEARGARVVNDYRIFRDELLLVEGRSVLACIDRQGRVRRLPQELLLGRLDK